MINFNRFYSIEYFLDSQCYKIAKSLKKTLKYKTIYDNYDEIVLITRIQKGGGLRDIYNKISQDKNILTLSTSIFDFRSLGKKDFFKQKSKKFLFLVLFLELKRFLVIFQMNRVIL